MFGTGFKADHLRSNLKLAITRLKLLEKKKTELVQRKRKEIADYIVARKHDNARIQVEHIIREDYMVEVLSILDLYCQHLLDRLGTIKTIKELSPELEEAVSSVIWCAPRVEADIPELKPISIELCSKYGKKYGKLCQEGKAESINPKLMEKLSTIAPSTCLVEKYLIEISNHYDIPYEADDAVLVTSPHLHLGIYEPTQCNTFLPPFKVGVEQPYHSVTPVSSVSPPPQPLGVYGSKKLSTLLPPSKVGIELSNHLDAEYNPGYYYAGSSGCFQTEFPENKVPPALPAIPPSCDPLPHGYVYASVKRH